MSRPVRFRRVAQAEYDDALDYYGTIDADLGKRFEAAVAVTLADIGANPYQFAEESPGARAAPVPGFSYALYYHVLPARVEVFCVFHTSRDPSIWQARA